jgi:hypothetical protein
LILSHGVADTLHVAAQLASVADLLQFTKPNAGLSHVYLSGPAAHTPSSGSPSSGTHSGTHRPPAHASPQVPEPQSAFVVHANRSNDGSPEQCWGLFEQLPPGQSLFSSHGLLLLDPPAQRVPCPAEFPSAQPTPKLGPAASHAGVHAFGWVGWPPSDGHGQSNSS